MVVEVRILNDLDKRALAIHVVDLSDRCKLLSEPLEVRVVELHDLKRYHPHCSPDDEKQILPRREFLTTQTGWDLFETIEVSNHPPVLIAGSNQAKRKHAKKLALVAAVTLLDYDKATKLCYSKSGINFVQDVHRKWTEPGDRFVVRHDVIEKRELELVQWYDCNTFACLRATCKQSMYCFPHIIGNIVEVARWCFDNHGGNHIIWLCVG